MALLLPDEPQCMVHHVFRFGFRDRRYDTTFGQPSQAHRDFDKFRFQLPRFSGKYLRDATVALRVCNTMNLCPRETRICFSYLTRTELPKGGEKQFIIFLFFFFFIYCFFF